MFRFELRLKLTLGVHLSVFEEGEMVKGQRRAEVL